MTRKRSAAVFIKLVLSPLSLVVADIAPAATIKILAGSAIEPAMVEFIPRFEQPSGHRVAFDFNGTIGGMTDRIQNGEAADVVIVSGPQIDMLEKRTKVTSGTRIDVAKVGVGVFVRKGAPKPDVSSVEAFKRAMLAARSIGWNDPAAGAPVSLYMIGLFEQLGIAGDMKPKTVVFKQRSERFEAVARGDVEIGFNQISEILAAAGVDLVGPLPDPIQNYTLFAGGIVTVGRQPEAARAFLRFVASPDARAVWTAKGFEAP